MDKGWALRVSQKALGFWMKQGVRPIPTRWRPREDQGGDAVRGPGAFFLWHLRRGNKLAFKCVSVSKSSCAMSCNH